METFGRRLAPCRREQLCSSTSRSNRRNYWKPSRKRLLATRRIALSVRDQDRSLTNCNPSPHLETDLASEQISCASARYPMSTGAALFSPASPLLPLVVGKSTWNMAPPDG